MQEIGLIETFASVFKICWLKPRRRVGKLARFKFGPGQITNLASGLVAVTAKVCQGNHEFHSRVSAFHLFAKSLLVGYTGFSSGKVFWWFHDD